MIKLDHLNQILAQLQQKFTCPRCQQNYGIGYIEMVESAGNSIKLVGKCPHCEARANIGVKLETRIMTPQELTEKEKNPSNLIPLKSSLEVSRSSLKKKIEGFNGNDIRDMFLP